MMISNTAPADVRAYTHALAYDPCAYCGRAMRHLDHIQPKARGGEDKWTNLTAACFWCNIEKQGASLLGFLAHRRHVVPEPRNPRSTYCVKGEWRAVGL